MLPPSPPLRVFQKLLTISPRRYITDKRQILPAQTITHVLKHAPLDARVTVHGWVRSVRVQKRVSFANVSDGSNAAGIQAVLNEEQAKG